MLILTRTIHIYNTQYTYSDSEILKDISKSEGFIFEARKSKDFYSQLLAAEKSKGFYQKSEASILEYLDLAKAKSEEKRKNRKLKVPPPKNAYNKSCSLEDICLKFYGPCFAVVR